MMRPVEKISELTEAEAQARKCWDRLFLHAHTGNCGCHLDVGGSVHVIHGCMAGRSLNDDYAFACERVRELSPKLETGDFDKPLVSEVSV